MFSIKSNASSRELVFLDARTDYFSVELRGHDLTASRTVYSFSPHGAGIAALFDRLGQKSHPWSGTESWSSLEGEFSLAVTCSTLGTVKFDLELTYRIGGPEDWSLSVEILSELGQLDLIAAEASVFFGG